MTNIKLESFAPSNINVYNYSIYKLHVGISLSESETIQNEVDIRPMKITTTPGWRKYESDDITTLQEETIVAIPKVNDSGMNSEPASDVQQRCTASDVQNQKNSKFLFNEKDYQFELVSNSFN